MIAANLGAMLGGFLVAVVIGFVWLALTWVIPYFRRNKRTWFMFAAAVTWLFGFVPIGGYTIAYAFGAAFFTAYGFWRTRPKPAPAEPPAPVP